MACDNSFEGRKRGITDIMGVMSATENNNTKAKFQEALEKKKNRTNIVNNRFSGNSKVSGEQTSGSTPKMFRRKSGSD